MEEKKPLWKVVEDAIAESTGIYHAYWLAFKERHPELYDVPGSPKWENPYNPSNLRTREFVTPIQPKPVLQTLVCKRCNHEWQPRTNKSPVQCPRCKSPYWNRERKKG